ncbi:hypothetical protein SAMN02787076_01102 [Rhizobacter sp. OV335]|nr:hypothetical protein SAMN02787076_01102 [Rhizobacter sp. OV335]
MPLAGQAQPRSVNQFASEIVRVQFVAANFILQQPIDPNFLPVVFGLEVCDFNTVEVLDHVSMVTRHNPDLMKSEFASDRDVADAGPGVSRVVVREGGAGTAKELLHRERDAIGMTSVLSKRRAVCCDQSAGLDGVVADPVLDDDCADPCRSTGIGRHPYAPGSAQEMTSLRSSIACLLVLVATDEPHVASARGLVRPLVPTQVPDCGSPSESAQSERRSGATEHARAV